MRNNDFDTAEKTPNWEEAIRGLGSKTPIPPFRVTEWQPQPKLRPSWEVPDGIVELAWEGQAQRFAAEYKSPGTPKQIEFAIQQVRRYTKDNPDLAPLIVAPYISPRMLDRLVQEGISGIDLSGNYAIVLPGRWLVIQANSGNKYPSGAVIKNVYKGKSSLIARALMIRGEFPSASAIMKDLQALETVSPPTVSKVLRTLEDELIIEREGRIKVVQPELLLQNLSKNYEPPRERRRLTGKIELDVTKSDQLDRNARRYDILYAATSPERYTVLPSSDTVTVVFTSSINQLLVGTTIDTASRFPDLQLIETTEPWIYYDRRKWGELFWTSPLQVYLELATGGKREKQAAEPLRKDLLAFKYR